MLLRIDATIYIDVAADADPEDVARDFDLGFENAVSGFGMTDVVYAPQIERADVKAISVVSPIEKEEAGLMPE